MTTIATVALKKRFIKRAELVLDRFFDSALNPDPSYKTMSDNAQNKIFDALVPIIQSTADVQKLEVKNAQAVIKLLQSGTVSVNDAVKLMSLIDNKFQIEEMQEMTKKLDALVGGS
jgi:hypothetical protein